MAFFLKRAKTYFENADMPSNEIVLSVPTYASNVERQAYLDAAEIAGIKCVRLINESTAIALNYGFFRKADLSAEKPRIVCFIDFVYIVRPTNHQKKGSSEGNDRKGV